MNREGGRIRGSGLPARQAFRLARGSFLRGQVGKYTLGDFGSSYVPRAWCSALLCGQLEMLDAIAHRRRQIRCRYRQRLEPLESRSRPRLPRIPERCTSNDPMSCVLLATAAEYGPLLVHLRAAGFRYIRLHRSPMSRNLGCADTHLSVVDDLAAYVVCLPMYYDLTAEERVVAGLTGFARWFDGAGGRQRPEQPSGSPCRPLAGRGRHNYTATMGNASWERRTLPPLTPHVAHPAR